MAKPSKEVLAELAEKLAHPWGQVSLVCDGRRITLQVQRYGKGMTYRVMTFIDGVFKYEWALEKNAAPEAKFLRKSVRPHLSPAKRKEVEKQLGKRYVAKHPFWGGSTTIYLPDWSSGKAALAHLCKVCASVEVAPAETAITAE